MISDLLSEIRAHGHRGAVVPFSRIDDLKRDMLELKNGAFHTEWIDRMVSHITDDANKFIPSEVDFEPQSIITIIMPNPKVIFEFRYKGKSIPCVIPPIYSNWDLINKQALQYLEDFLSPHGYFVAMVITLPQKMLAVHSGLALYGRNNICYCPEFGSHMQIMSYISDLPCVDDIWFPIRRMEACEKCLACAASCPTGAISIDHRLINSDKCITLANENPEKFPVGFPDWIDEKAHNSITGCTLCQDCCPGNARKADARLSGVAFTEGETIEILNSNGNTSYSDSVSAKLEILGLPPEYSRPIALSRNLAALLHKESIIQSIADTVRYL